MQIVAAPSKSSCMLGAACSIRRCGTPYLSRERRKENESGCSRRSVDSASDMAVEDYHLRTRRIGNDEPLLEGGAPLAERIGSRVIACEPADLARFVPATIRSHDGPDSGEAHPIAVGLEVAVALTVVLGLVEHPSICHIAVPFVEKRIIVDVIIVAVLHELADGGLVDLRVVIVLRVWVVGCDEVAVLVDVGIDIARIVLVEFLVGVILVFDEGRVIAALNVGGDACACLVDGAGLREIDVRLDLNVLIIVGDEPVDEAAIIDSVGVEILLTGDNRDAIMSHFLFLLFLERRSSRPLCFLIELYAFIYGL